MYKRILLITTIIIVAAILFWHFSAFQETFYKIVIPLEKYFKKNELLGFILFIFIAIASALLSPLTNAPLIPVAVALWGTTITMILLFGGWIIGDITAYYLGKQIGRPIIRYIISAERFDKGIEAIRKHTRFYMLLLLRIALPAELGYAFGVIRYHFGKYLFLTFLANIPFVFITTYASKAVLDGERLRFFGLLAVLGIILFGAMYFARNSQNKKRGLLNQK